MVEDISCTIQQTSFFVRQVDKPHIMPSSILYSFFSWACTAIGVHAHEIGSSQFPVSCNPANVVLHFVLAPQLERSPIGLAYTIVLASDESCTFDLSWVPHACKEEFCNSCWIMLNSGKFAQPQRDDPNGNLHPCDTRKALKQSGHTTGQTYSPCYFKSWYLLLRSFVISSHRKHHLLP